MLFIAKRKKHKHIKFHWSHIRWFLENYMSKYVKINYRTDCMLRSIFWLLFSTLAVVILIFLLTLTYKFGLRSVFLVK